VPVLADALDRRSETAARNREAVLTHLAEIEEQLDLARAGGGQKYVERHHGRGKLLARERIELLVDRDSPFLELSPLAAWGTAFPVGASVVTGIGVIEGVECMLIANDPTVRGGATNPVTAKKVGRAMDVARENRLHQLLVEPLQRRFSEPAAGLRDAALASNPDRLRTPEPA